MFKLFNSRSLIGLAVVGQFDLLRYLFGQIWVLMDEKKGRRKLSEMNLNKVGTVGLLLKGKQVGFLPEIGPHLEMLRRQGFSLSRVVIESTLRQANE